MVLIAAGAALVGMSSLLHGKQHMQEDERAVLGLVMILLAQALNAVQFVAEEKFLKQVQPPVLVAVGTEGITGLVCCLVSMPLASQLLAPDGRPLDEVANGITSIMNDGVLQLITMGIILSIAAFNFTGITVTKNLSGAARAAIDASRTALIWMFGIYVGWERIHGLQVIGFGILITGTSVYNDILRSCMPRVVDLGETSANALTASLLGQQDDDSSDTADSSTPAEQIRHQTLPVDTHRSRDYNIVTMARSITILPGAWSPHSFSQNNSVTDDFEASVNDD